MDKILIIDDAESLLTTLKAYLEDSGYDIYCAKNGREGLELFAKVHPDLVLTDLHMPELSGLEVLSKITKDNAGIPVMVISGAGELHDAIQALRLGAWDYITKPIADLQVLEHTVTKALERKKLLAENQEFTLRNEYNLKVLKEDQAAGRRVQMSLLPPEHFARNGFNINFRITPSLDLSGDFVEYFSISEHEVGVYLADVSGHGSSSAFITILLKSIIDQYKTRAQISGDQTIRFPEHLLHGINNELYASKYSKYITITYGILNLKSGEFTYCVAGHYPSPILLKASGKMSFLPGSGYPLGIRKNVKYLSFRVAIQPGDKVIIFSDGVLEVLLPDKNLAQKEKALLEVVKDHQGRIPDICKAIGISRRHPIDQPDDITILTVGRDSK